MTAPSANPASAEIAAIHAILEPWMWVEAYGQPYHGLVTSRIASGPYSFEGIIKPDLEKMTRGTSGRACRACLTGRAEDVIDALAVAGWLLVGGLRVEVKSRTAPFTQTLDGELVEPGELYDVECKVWFEVDRPR